MDNSGCLVVIMIIALAIICFVAGLSCGTDVQKEIESRGLAPIVTLAPDRR